MAGHIPIQAMEGKVYRDIESSVRKTPPTKGSLKWHTPYEETHGLDPDTISFVKVRGIKVLQKDVWGGMAMLQVDVNRKSGKIENIFVVA